jgi:iron complex outermembrane receptor protein
VPISIGVVTASDIDRRSLVGSDDYLRGIPGVNQVEGGTQGQAIIIRGLETQTTLQNITSGSTVATYFGEAPTTASGGIVNSSNIDLKLVDIERVEVLRGPQGTAFGAGSLTGTVRTIPAAPNLGEFQGKVSAGYSLTANTGGDNYNFQAIGNFPVINEKLALRAVGYRFDESGFYRNRAASDSAYMQSVTELGGQDYAKDEEEVGSSSYMGGRIAALFKASDALKVTLSYLSQTIEIDGFSGANSGLFDQTILQVAEEDRRRGETGQLSDTKIDIASASIDADLGWADLVATYSYTESEAHGPITFSSFDPGVRAWPLSYNAHSLHRANVAEVRLATSFDGPWNFLAGVYYEDFKDQGGEDYTWHGDPEENFWGARYLGGFLEHRDQSQIAGFGEVSWEFVEGFTFTGGARYFDYDRQARLDAGGGPFYEGPVASSASTSAAGTNYRANLSYKSSDNVLVYAGFSQGFRLGRAQVGFPAGACDQNGDGLVDGTSASLEALKRIKPDDVDNYEIGTKITMLDRRLALEASVYRMNWHDIPFSVVPSNLLTLACRTALTGTNAGTVANVGEARSDGVEAQLNFYVTQKFRLDLGGSWTDARLLQDVPGTSLTADQKLPGAPDVNGNLGLQYEFGIAGYDLSVRADAIYVGGFNIAFTPPASESGSRAGDYVKIDASARAMINNLNLDLFIHNLTNEDAYTSRWFAFGDDPYYGMRMRPRTVGLQLSYTF